MPLLAMLARRCAARSLQPRPGQTSVFFAIFIMASLEMVGLGIDVGHAYERRQFLQGAATNTADSGAFEVYGNSTALTAPSAAIEDAAVVKRMVDTLAQSGLTVNNYVPASNTLTQLTDWSACHQKLPVNSVDLQAFYIDSNNQPISPTTTYVGSGAMPSGAQGVQVAQLTMCVSHFFVGVVGFGNFDIGSSAFAGRAATSGVNVVDTSKAPFYIYGRKCIDGSQTYSCDALPYSLFARGSPDGSGHTYQAATCPGLSSPCTGDLVTLNDKGNGQQNWDAYQFVTSDAGLANVPSSPLQLGSQSDRGCLNPGLTSLSIGQWSFNRNGNGSHCGTTPSAGSSLLLPLVDEVCKNDSCGITDPYSTTIGNCVTGGYCVHVVGFVQVFITQDLSSGALVRGYITRVLDDPYCIVEAPAGQTHPNPESECP